VPWLLPSLCRFWGDTRCILRRFHTLSYIPSCKGLKRSSRACWGTRSRSSRSFGRWCLSIPRSVPVWVNGPRLFPLMLHYTCPLSMCYSLGARKFNSAYAKCLSLQRKTTFGLNALIESASSWIVIPDGSPNALPGGVSVKSLHDVACVWAKTRSSIRMALATLTDDPAENLRYYSSSMTPTRKCPRSSIMRWMMNLACFT